METDATPNAALPKSRRRWHQYNLRTLLIGVTLLCVWFGLIATNANRQRRAVETIKRHGGTVAYDYETNAEAFDVRDDAPQPGPAWLRNLIGIDYFATVVVVSSPDEKGSNERDGDDTFATISELPHLRSVVLTGSGVADSAVEQVKGLAELRGLYLFGTNVSDGGLKKLAGLSRLERLNLSNSGKITDIGLQYVHSLPCLEFLDARGTKVTAAGVEDLRRAHPEALIIGP